MCKQGYLAAGAHLCLSSPWWQLFSMLQAMQHQHSSVNGMIASLHGILLAPALPNQLSALLLAACAWLGGQLRLGSGIVNAEASLPVQRCKVMLLDDIISALDPPTSAWVVSRGILGTLSVGTTKVLVTHDQACAAKADTVITMHAGTIRNVARQPKQPKLGSRERHDARSLDHTLGSSPGSHRVLGSAGGPQQAPPHQPARPGQSVSSPPATQQPQPLLDEGQSQAMPPKEARTSWQQAGQGLLSRQLGAQASTSPPTVSPDALGSPDAAQEPPAAAAADQAERHGELSFKSLQQAEGPAEHVLDVVPAATDEDEEARQALCLRLSALLCAQQHLAIGCVTLHAD